MPIYTADLKWTASEGEDFLKGRFSRTHTLSFDGGTVVPASASPHVVGNWKDSGVRLYRCNSSRSVFVGVE